LGKFYVTLAPFFIILGAFCNHFGTTFGQTLDCFGSILEPIWGNSEAIPGQFGNHFWAFQGPFWDHFRIILGTVLQQFWGNSGVVL